MKKIRKKIDELRLFLNEKPSFYKFLIVFILNLIVANLTFGQERITKLDEKSIKNAARKLISENLKSIYTDILEINNQDDREETINTLITLKNGALPLFKDEFIQVEDDFLTRNDYSTNSGKEIKIIEYFKAIGASYGKPEFGVYNNEGKNLEITDLILSDIIWADDKSFKYLNAYFNIKYDGIDNRTKLPFKQPDRRVATIEIQKYSGRWQPSIRALRFEREDEMNKIDLTKKVLIEKNTEKENEEAAKTLIEEEKKTVFKKQNLILRAYKNNEKWGLKNVETEEIILMPTYDYIEEFSIDELASVNLEGLWGYIDIFGNLTIKCEYDNAEAFSKDKKGRAHVQKGMEWFYIDKIGNRIK